MSMNLPEDCLHRRGRGPLRLARLAACWLAGASALLAVAAAEEATPKGVLNLTPADAPVRPGHPFTLAIDLALPAGWHTYWLNPGETGMAPDFRWTLPTGVRLTAVHYPVPQRFDDGISISIGYENAVRLLADFTTDASLSLPAAVELKALWMICKDLCMPVESQASVMLRPAAGGTPDRLAPARNRLPQPATGWRMTVAREDGHLTVRIVPPPQLNLSDEAWKQALLLPVQRDTVALDEPGNWKRVDGAWTTRLKAGLAKPEGGRFAAVLIFSSQPETGWLLEGTVSQ